MTIQPKFFQQKTEFFPMSGNDKNSFSSRRIFFLKVFIWTHWKQFSSSTYSFEHTESSFGNQPNNFRDGGNNSFAQFPKKILKKKLFQKTSFATKCSHQHVKCSSFDKLADEIFEKGQKKFISVSKIVHKKYP